LLLVCGAGLVLWSYNVFVAPTAWPPVGVALNPVWSVRSVAPNSAAALAGIKTGDVLDVGRATPAQRWAYTSRRRIGDRITYFVARNGTVVPATVVVTLNPPWNVDTWLGTPV
jgi:S1-C subfamily serine protease